MDDKLALLAPLITEEYSVVTEAIRVIVVGDIQQGGWNGTGFIYRSVR